MKRTKDKGDLRHYRKIGGGSLRLPGRLIKPNQEFWAHPNELPKGSKDVLLALDGGPTEPPEKEPVPVKTMEYTLKHRSGGYYHVFDANGKQMTEEAKKKEEAEEYIASLKGE